MKRFFCFLLCCTLLSLCVLPAAAVPAKAEASSSLVTIQTLPKAIIRRTVDKALEAYQTYASSVRLFLYAFRGKSGYHFGPNSLLSRRLAASAPAERIAIKAIRSGNTEQSGSLSFYGCGDLEYAIGVADYTLLLQKTEDGWDARFTVYDLYDFDGVRDGKGISELLNNIGYYLQKRGVLKTYVWFSDFTVHIPEGAV